MRTTVVMIRFRTSKDWSTLKVEARTSITDAAQYLYNVITNNDKIGDITIDGVVHTKDDVLALYDELTSP
jgi:hypothetical protein